MPAGNLVVDQAQRKRDPRISLANIRFDEAEGVDNRAAKLAVIRARCVEDRKVGAEFSIASPKFPPLC